MTMHELRLKMKTMQRTPQEWQGMTTRQHHHKTALPQDSITTKQHHHKTASPQDST